MENKLDYNFFLNESIQISFTNFLTNLLVTLILSYLARFVYIKFSPSLSNKKDFANNFIILGIATCIIITIVKNSIALSLGLVGALSIVRFRAAIKEPGELVYLFLIIAAGIGCGSGQIKITVIGILFSLFAIILSKKILNSGGIVDQENYNILITLENNEETKLEINSLNKSLKEITNKIEFISLHKTSNEIILNYNAIIDKTENVDDLVKKINEKFNGAQITISKNDYFPA